MKQNIIIRLPHASGPTARAPHTGYARHQCEYIVWGTVGGVGLADGRGPFPGCYTIPVDPQEKEHQAGKPVELMRKLARMVPPGGVILDPFNGSGSTGVGALLEGRRYLGIERDPQFVALSQHRLARAAAYQSTLHLVATERAPRGGAAPMEPSAPGAWQWRASPPRDEGT